MFLGEKPVREAYLGTTKVYPNSSLAVTGALAFAAAGGGQSLAITVESGQAWTLSGVPNGWSASATTGIGPASVVITASNNTSTAARNGTLIVASDGLSASCSLSQAAGAQVYAAPVVSLAVADIPASGGTVSSGTVGYSQSWTWNGVAGSGGTLTAGGAVSYSAAVSAGSLSTTVRARTAVGTLTATVAMNGQSGSASATVYQAENRIESGTDDDLLNKRAVTRMVITASPGSITANGGSTTFKAQLQSVCTYTSGAQSIRYDTAGILARSSSGNFSVSSPGTLESDGRTFSFTVSASQNSSTSSRSTTITICGAAAYATDTKTTVSVSQTGQPNTATIKFTDLSGNTISEIACASDGLLMAEVPLAAATPLALKPIGRTQFSFRVVPSNSAMEWMMDAGNGTYFANNCGSFSCTTDGTICYPTLAAGGTLRFTGQQEFTGMFTGAAGASFAFYVRYTSASGNATLTVKGT
ncbi:BACON domain-containing protein [uncultured Rikenella sp.]|uniref:BACON domain-containing protein n=1 Tax=uncultured Rikenella sp. TaxID=368003 RepID=UPI0025DD35C6|nr:BACON domain-containing protein [uncultured Rikenella sp.]